MKTLEIVRDINSSGGLDMSFIERQANRENISVRKYITCYIKSCYNCSSYVAKNVANYYC